MVTGIEAAGLVLGAFPIVIDGLRYYIDSVKKAKQAACHKYVLPRFIRDIETGMTIFVDTWYHLTGYYPPQVTAGGLPEACIPKLPTHLRPKSIASMCTVCENMLGVLEELRKKLEKYKKSEAGYSKMLQFTFSLTEEYRVEQLALIRLYNMQFRELVNGAQSLVVTETKSMSVAKRYRRVRDHAISTYNVLREKLEALTCACTVHHSAYLQLEMRAGGIQNEYLADQEFGSVFRFNFVFPVPFGQSVAACTPRWRELEVESLEENLDGPIHTSSEYTNIPLAAKTEEESTIGMTIEHMTEAIRLLGSSSSMSSGDTDSVATAKLHSEGLETGVTVSVVREQPSSVIGRFGYWVQEKTGGSRGWKSRSASPMPGSTHTIQQRDTKNPRKVTFGLPDASRDPPCPTPSNRIQQGILADNIIQCLCTSICNATEADACLGVLVSRDDRKHRVWIPRRLCVTANCKFLTLAEMLSLPHEPLKLERLKLGVKLASSVMQLHTTEWLGESWSKEDIKFFLQLELDERRKSVIDYPFLHQNFLQPNTADSPSQDAVEASLIPCNQRLYSLGIVLIELWHWKGFECLRRVALPGPGITDNGDGSGNEYFAALRLAKQLYQDAGASYGEAVRRCIQGLDTSETSLENDEFKDKVYSEIVRPLETNLETFSGKRIAEIFVT